MASRYLLEILRNSDDPDVASQAKCLIFSSQGIEGVGLREVFSPLQSDSTAGKQKVIQTINKFNSDPAQRIFDLTLKHLRSSSAGEKVLCQQMSDIHARWFRRDKDRGRDFDYQYIRRYSSELIGWIDSKGVGLKNAMKLSGINPDCHFGYLDLGESDAEKEFHSKTLIQQMVDQFGLENLNYNSIQTSLSDSCVKVPWLKDDNSNYPACDDCNCNVKLPTVRSVVARAEEIFGSWEEAITNCGFDYSIIKRKEQKRPAEFYIEGFAQYIYSNSSWNVLDFKSEEPFLYKGLFNLKDRDGLYFLDAFNQDVMKAAYLEASAHLANIFDLDSFYQQHQEALESDWKLRRNFDQTHSARGIEFEKWFKDSLLDNGFIQNSSVELLSETEFVYQHLFPDIGRKPDFVFKDFIIDTKTTYAFSSKVDEQFQDFGRIKSRLFCVTLRQEGRRYLANGRCVDMVILKLSTLIPEFSECTFDTDSCFKRIQIAADNSIQDNS